MSCYSYGKNIFLITLIFFLSCLHKNTEKKVYVIKSDKKEEESFKPDFPSQIFSLSKTPNYTLEEKLREIVDNAWEKTYEKYLLNFNYSISPEGAIYPYSEVKIVCLTDSKTFLSTKFNENCNYFFNIIKNNLSKIKGEKQ